MTVIVQMHIVKTLPIDLQLKKILIQTHYFKIKRSTKMLLVNIN
jgi:hypothetical protein